MVVVPVIVMPVVVPMVVVPMVVVPVMMSTFLRIEAVHQNVKERPRDHGHEDSQHGRGQRSDHIFARRKTKESGQADEGDDHRDPADAIERTNDPPEEQSERDPMQNDPQGHQLQGMRVRPIEIAMMSVGDTERRAIHGGMKAQTQEDEDGHPAMRGPRVNLGLQQDGQQKTGKASNDGQRPHGVYGTGQEFEEREPPDGDQNKTV